MVGNPFHRSAICRTGYGQPSLSGALECGPRQARGDQELRLMSRARKGCVRQTLPQLPQTDGRPDFRQNAACTARSPTTASCVTSSMPDGKPTSAPSMWTSSTISKRRGLRSTASTRVLQPTVQSATRPGPTSRSRPTARRATRTVTRGPSAMTARGATPWRYRSRTPASPSITARPRIRSSVHTRRCVAPSATATNGTRDCASASAAIATETRTELLSVRSARPATAPWHGRPPPSIIRAPDSRSRGSMPPCPV